MRSPYRRGLTVLTELGRWGNSSNDPWELSQDERIFVHMFETHSQWVPSTHITPADRNADLATDLATDRARSRPTENLLRRLSSLSNDELVGESQRIGSLLSSARAELGLVLAEIEARELHKDFDCGTVERYASWQCQLSPSNARNTAALGRAVHELPVLGDALVEGRLSADKAVMIAKVAAPDSEAALVDLSQYTSMGQLQKVCNSWRAVANRSETPAPEDLESFSTGRVVVFHDDHGIELRASFDHIHGALVLSALDAVTAHVRAERLNAAISHGVSQAGGLPADVNEMPIERLTREQWRAEGFVRMCELANGFVPGELQASGFSTQVVVHVPVDTLLHPTPLSDVHPGAADVLEPAGIVLRREAARWLACDAGLQTVLEDNNGDPLHLGHRTSAITPHLRRAVHARYRTCTWPGCTSTVVQLHHRHHRSVGGHDDLENLVPLCRFHHGVVHRRGITVARDACGELRFWRPDGSEVSAAADPQPPGAPPPAPAGEASNALEQQHHDCGINTSDRRRLPQWMNDPFHLGDIIEALQARRDAARRRTHPTGSVTHGSVTIHSADHRADHRADSNRSRKNSST